MWGNFLDISYVAVVGRANICHQLNISEYSEQSRPLWRVKPRDRGSGVISQGVKITSKSLSFHHRQLSSISRRMNQHHHHSEHTHARGSSKQLDYYKGQCSCFLITVHNDGVQHDVRRAGLCLVQAGCGILPWCEMMVVTRHQPRPSLGLSSVHSDHVIRILASRWPRPSLAGVLGQSWYE